jgi:enoyl-CoA hydratase
MAANQWKHLKVEDREAWLAITINRPEALNALNIDVLEELESVLLDELDPEHHRVVSIEGAGDKAFVAGADIASMQEMTSEVALEFAQFGQSVSCILESLPQITIAKVRGFALGGGCELAMACDIILAGKSAKFGQPEVNLGLIPGFGGTQRLVKRVGLPVALDLLTGGKARTLNADEAFTVGLVSRVVEDAELDATLRKTVEGILKAGPRAVSEVKRLARDAANMTLEAGLNSESFAFAQCFARDEVKEGIAAFLEKRSARFT